VPGVAPFDETMGIDPLKPAVVVPLALATKAGLSGETLNAFNTPPSPCSKIVGRSGRCSRLGRPRRRHQQAFA